VLFIATHAKIDKDNGRQPSIRFMKILISIGIECRNKYSLLLLKVLSLILSIVFLI
jgi:hypothetical protein